MKARRNGEMCEGREREGERSGRMEGREDESAERGGGKKKRR